MAHNRYISSSVWDDPDFGEMDYLERLLWIGLSTTYPDDQGRFINDPDAIVQVLFPRDKTIPQQRVIAAVDRFAAVKWLILYQAEGLPLAQVRDWWKVQYPRFAKPSKWPAPADWNDQSFAFGQPIITFIYGLVDPRTQQVCYVGKANNPDARLEAHLSEAYEDYRTDKARWLRILLGADLRPVLKILEQVPYADWPDREIHWIAFGRVNGWPLTNMTDGGEGAG